MLEIGKPKDSALREQTAQYIYTRVVNTETLIRQLIGYIAILKKKKKINPVKHSIFTHHFLYLKFFPP